MGGPCVNDLPNASSARFAEADRGRADDPIFGKLPIEFLAHAGHEGSRHGFAAGRKCWLIRPRPRQAFCFPGKPIYCTQFHPELDRAAMLDRVVAYPEYVDRIAQ